MVTYLTDTQVPQGYVTRLIREHIPAYLHRLGLDVVAAHVSADNIAQGFTGKPCVLALTPGDNFGGVCFLDMSLKPVAVVQHFYVSQQAHREVSPRVMLSMAEDRAKAGGCTLLVATTGLIKQNTQSNLYTRAGFNQIGAVYRKDLQ